MSGKQNYKLITLQVSTASCHSSFLLPSTLFSALLSDILKQRSYFNVRDHASHPYRTTYEIKNFEAEDRERERRKWVGCERHYI
jgi:hypothetical protein